MIKEFVKAWDLNKEALKEHFKTHKQDEYPSYVDLVKLLFDIVINPAISDYDGKYSTEEIYVIDDGDYQGTQIFILHKDCYQPDVEDYICTNVYYGSCSGCDTLQRIQEEFSIETRINDYMTLCLHLLQRCSHLTYVEEQEVADDD